MSKYVSNSTIESLQNISIDDHNLGGIREYVTVFFSDVRGFTSFSEKNEPETVVASLNDLLNLQVEIIKKHFGDIDKFVGDEIMAVFRGKDAENNAAHAAIEIQIALNDFYQSRKDLMQLHIGIGINSGDAVSGNIGSKERMDYTLIGDTVNTGARLCGAAAAGEIIVSESLINKCDKKRFRLSEGFSLNLKNKTSQQLYYKLIY
jgi:adenylate cyclase